MEQQSWTPHPYVYAPPPSPQQLERRWLRRKGNFAGALMLANTAGLLLTFNVLAILLLLTGVLDRSQLTQPLLGMDKMSYLLLYAGVYSFAMLVPAAIVALCGKRRYFPLSPAHRVNGFDAFLAVIACVGVCMLANVIGAYVTAFLEQFGATAPEVPDMLEHTPAGLALYIAVFAVLPALLEEAVMRGYLLRELRSFGDGAAVFMSALFFGMMHGNIRQIPFAFVVGLALGWLYVATENIWLPVAVHFCNNAASAIIEYLGDGMGDEAYTAFNLIVIGALIVLGLIAVAVLLCRRSELLRAREQLRSSLNPGQRWGTMFTSPVLLIALLVLLLQAIQEAV